MRRAVAGPAQAVRYPGLQLCHTLAALPALFDKPNLLDPAGLVPGVSLADRMGLRGLVEQWLTMPRSRGTARAKVMSLVAGLLAGADSIDDYGPAGPRRPGQGLQPDAGAFNSGRVPARTHPWAHAQDGCGRCGEMIVLVASRPTRVAPATGRVTSTNDGKATTTYAYDGTDSNGKTENRGFVTSMVVGGLVGASEPFRAAYDEDGRLLSETS